MRSYKYAPTLSFDAGDCRRWVLRDHLNTDNDDYSLELLINKNYGEYEFRTRVWMAGEWFWGVSREEHKERIKTIEEHENKEIADLWAEHQEEEMVLHEAQIDRMHRLQEHFMSMVTLNLIDLEASHTSWESKPLSNVVQDLMDAARHRSLEQMMSED